MVVADMEKLKGMAGLGLGVRGQHEALKRTVLSLFHFIRWDGVGV